MDIVYVEKRTVIGHRFGQTGIESDTASHQRITARVVADARSRYRLVRFTPHKSTNVAMGDPTAAYRAIRIIAGIRCLPFA